MGINLLKMGLVCSLALISLLGHSEEREIKCQRLQTSGISENDEPICWIGARDFWVDNKKITNGLVDYQIDQSPLRVALKVSQPEFQLKFAFLNRFVGFCWNDEVGGQSGLWRTTDEGQTWTPIAGGRISRCMANINGDGLYFYNKPSGSSPAVILWIDSKGSIGSRIELPKELDFGALLTARNGRTITAIFNVDAGSHALLGTAESGSGGETWKRFPVTLPSERGRVLAADANGRIEFVEGNTGNLSGHQIFWAQSANSPWRHISGTNWAEVYFTSEKQAFGLWVPKEKNYALVDLELWKSIDAGVHWSRVRIDGAKESYWEHLAKQFEGWQSGQQWALRHLAQVP